jgi:hypothetical protein
MPNRTEFLLMMRRFSLWDKNIGPLIAADHLLLSLLGERCNNIATVLALISSKL